MKLRMISSIDRRLSDLVVATHKVVMGHLISHLTSKITWALVASINPLKASSMKSRENSSEVAPSSEVDSVVGLAVVSSPIMITSLSKAIPTNSKDPQLPTSNTAHLSEAKQAIHSAACMVVIPSNSVMVGSLTDSTNKHHHLNNNLNRLKQQMKVAKQQMPTS